MPVTIPVVFTVWPFKGERYAGPWISVIDTLAAVTTVARRVWNKDFMADVRDQEGQLSTPGQPMPFKRLHHLRQHRGAHGRSWRFLAFVQ